MKLAEKLASLSPEQRVQLNAVKDMDKLAAFASEQGMELTTGEMQGVLEYIKTGVLPLEDEELEAATGGTAGAGATSHTEAAAMAKEQGYKHNLPLGNHLCVHNHNYKWAKTKHSEHMYKTVYKQIKCFKCGKEWDEWADIAAGA